MPNRDRTGPMGMGPLTGRGLGPCGAGLRRGLGFDLGRGFGRGLVFKEQKQALVDYRKALEEELEDVRKEEESIK